MRLILLPVDDKLKPYFEVREGSRLRELLGLMVPNNFTSVLAGFASPTKKRDDNT